MITLLAWVLNLFLWVTVGYFTDPAWTALVLAAVGFFYYEEKLKRTAAIYDEKINKLNTLISAPIEK